MLSYITFITCSSVTFTLVTGLALKILHCAHGVYFCDLYGSRNKEQVTPMCSIK